MGKCHQRGIWGEKTKGRNGHINAELDPGFKKKKKSNNNANEYLLSTSYEPGKVHSLQCLWLLSKSFNPHEWVLMLSSLAEEDLETQGPSLIARSSFGSHTAHYSPPSGWDHALLRLHFTG